MIQLFSLIFFDVYVCMASICIVIYLFLLFYWPLAHLQVYKTKNPKEDRGASSFFSSIEVQDEMVDKVSHLKSKADEVKFASYFFI